MQSECTVGVHSRGAQPTGSEEQVRDRATAMPMEGCSLFMKPPDASRRFRASTRKAPAPDTKRRLRGAEPGRRLEKRITAVPSVGEEPRSLLYRWVRSRDLLRYPRGTEHVIPEGGSPLFYYNGPGLDVHVSRTRQLHYYYHGGAALASSFSLFFESASRSLHSSRSARSTGACRVRRHISRSSISSERIPVNTPVSHSATPRFPALIPHTLAHSAQSSRSARFYSGELALPCSLHALPQAGEDGTLSSAPCSTWNTRAPAPRPQNV